MWPSYLFAPMMSDPSRTAVLMLAALVLAMGRVGANAGSTPQCSDPCLKAARGELRASTSSASGAFMDAVGSCVERDQECVDACRGHRQACRDGTTLGGDLLTCRLELAAAKEMCRTSVPLGSRLRAICSDRAEIADFRCRRIALERVHDELRTCRSDFDQCVDACAPGAPPGGVGTCRSEAKAAFRDVLAGYKLVHRAMTSACINKDVACVPDCDETRSSCTAPIRAILDAAIASCGAQRASDLSACATANPAGSAALQACVDAAGATASTCRDGALAASEPGFTACAGQYVACLRACPAG